MRPSAAGLLLLVLGACGDRRPATEVILYLDAEPDVREMTTRLQLRVRGAPPSAIGTWTERFDRTLGQGSEPIQWPVTLGMGPVGGDAARAFEVTAWARGGAAGEIELARVRAVSTYVKEQTLYLHLVMEDECLMRTCDADLTCRRGDCVDAFVDPGMLEHDAPRPVVQPRDGGTGGRTDAGPDADADSPGDGGDGADTGTPASCGNERLEAGEGCDDGNTERLDGCAACASLPAARISGLRLVIDEGLDGVDEADRARWCDLDGDGSTDNAFADLGDQGTLAAIFDLDPRAADASLALVFDGLDLAAVAGTGMDLDARVALLWVTNAMGGFVVAPESYATDGTLPVAATGVGPMSSVRFDTDRFAFFVGSTRVDLRRATVTAMVVPSADRTGVALDGTVCGALSIATLATLPPVLPYHAGSASLAEGLVRGSTTPALRLDVDLDGDGLERIDAVDGVIQACLDGDGASIPGPDCVGDARIVDGFSAFLAFEAERASVSGPPSP